MDRALIKIIYLIKTNGNMLIYQSIPQFRNIQPANEVPSTSSSQTPLVTPPTTTQSSFAEPINQYVFLCIVYNYYYERSTINPICYPPSSSIFSLISH